MKSGVLNSVSRSTPEATMEFSSKSVLMDILLRRVRAISARLVGRVLLTLSRYSVRRLKRPRRIRAKLRSSFIYMYI